MLSTRFRASKATLSTRFRASKATFSTRFWGFKSHVFHKVLGFEKPCFPGFGLCKVFNAISTGFWGRKPMLSTWFWATFPRPFHIVSTFYTHPFHIVSPTFPHRFRDLSTSFPQPKEALCCGKGWLLDVEKKEVFVGNMWKPGGFRAWKRRPVVVKKDGFWTWKRRPLVVEHMWKAGRSWTLFVEKVGNSSLCKERATLDLSTSFPQPFHIFFHIFFHIVSATFPHPSASLPQVLRNLSATSP